MLLEYSDVLSIIPQKPPMVMVDGLVDSDDTTTTSRLVLNEQNIFCKNGYFHEPGLIENIAQTAALRAGFAAHQNKNEVETGFIGAVKKLKINDLPKDTSVLQTTITVLTKIANATIIKGEVYIGSKLMAEGEMSIFKQ
ncbi:MAG: hydroxymyristoyl-ACP dehydratase [Bacteroidales bacterium]|jgi:predicted hotdog family 3-hydroxylacyl-ACP dehydratase|nr:hydroxymyristoyl-ACP dehydratase [Bacteroidales bacterium]